MTEYIIRFPGQWITADQFEQALHQVSVPSFSRGSSITFRFLPACKVMVDAAVRLLSLANQLASEGMPVTMVFEDEPNGAMSYLNRANFFSLLSEKVRILPVRPDPSYTRLFYGNSRNLVEFEPVSPTYSERIDDPPIPTRLADALTTVMEGYPDLAAFRGATYLIFGELINNIRDHSQTRLDGFAALQVYDKGKKVQVVVSDSGIGLLNTLRPKLLTQVARDVSEAELIRLLFHNELMWSKRGSGQGLFECAHRALKYEGSVNIRLETCSVQLRPAHGIYESISALYRSNLVQMKGTHICFSFPLSLDNLS